MIAVNGWNKSPNIFGLRSERVKSSKKSYKASLTPLQISVVVLKVSIIPSNLVDPSVPAPLANGSLRSMVTRPPLPLSTTERYQTFLLCINEWNNNKDKNYFAISPLLEKY